MKSALSLDVRPELLIVIMYCTMNGYHILDVKLSCNSQSTTDSFAIVLNIRTYIYLP